MTLHGLLTPLACVVVAVGVAGCAAPADLRQAVVLDGITTGWFDAGIVDGKNKLVPSVSFRLKNTGSTALGTVAFNFIFRRVGDPEEWTTVLVRDGGASHLAAGQSTPAIVVRAPQGYTGIQPRQQILENRLFIDAKVEVFAKHGSAQWVKLADVPIARQLLVR